MDCWNATVGYDVWGRAINFGVDWVRRLSLKQIDEFGFVLPKGIF